MSEDAPLYGTPRQYASAEVADAISMAEKIGARHGLTEPPEFSIWAERFRQASYKTTIPRLESAFAAGRIALTTMSSPATPAPETTMDSEAWIHALRCTVAAGLLVESAPGRSVTLSKLARATLHLVTFIVAPPSLEHVPNWIDRDDAPRVEPLDD